MASKSVRGPPIDTSSRNRLAYVQKNSGDYAYILKRKKPPKKTPNYRYRNILILKVETLYELSKLLPVI